MKIDNGLEDFSKIGIGFSKKKKITVSKAKKRAWAVFSQYIRQSYANELGVERCYTCNNVAHWKQMQAGHGIAGRNNAVLFMEEVVKPQCVGCNLYGRGKSSIFTEKLIDELGMKRFAELVRQSNEVVQYKVNDYLRIEQEYKDKLSQL